MAIHKGWEAALWLATLATMLLFALVQSAEAVEPPVADPECAGPFHDPSLVYPAEDGTVHVCSPQTDANGVAIPAGTALDCLLEVSVSDVWKPYALANVLPGQHVVFTTTDAWERPARASCSAGSVPGEVLSFTARFRGGTVTRPALLPR